MDARTFVKNRDGIKTGYMKHVHLIDIVVVPRPNKYSTDSRYAHSVRGQREGQAIARKIQVCLGLPRPAPGRPSGNRETATGGLALISHQVA